MYSVEDDYLGQGDKDDRRGAPDKDKDNDNDKEISLFCSRGQRTLMRTRMKTKT